MIKILDFVLCSETVLIELIAIFSIAMLIQLIFYRVFKINLYKISKDILINLERRMQKCF